MTFAKATLEAIGDKPADAPKRIGEPVTVQINPASLRVQSTSGTDGGKDAGRSKTQYQGATSTLTFDLYFDSADEAGKDGAAVDVRVRTRKLQRFVLPEMGKAKQAPPRLRFTYGTFSVIGVMTGLNEDYDFFTAEGTPVRAKCGVTIKVQRPEFEAGKEGPGANEGAGATTPVPAPGAPPPAPRPNRTATALAGESAPDFANRMGLDPAAWKGLQGITDPARLEAGLRIDFSTALQPPAGLAVTTGAMAGDVSAPVSAGTGPAPAGLPVDGAGLTSAGGLSRALGEEATRTAGAAAASARAAFAPATPAAEAAGADDQRALTFGYGVPLRPRLGAARPGTTGLVHQRRTGVSGGDRPPETDDPTVPRWRALGPAAGATGTACCGGTR
jgi:hypothetical protein